MAEEESRSLGKRPMYVDLDDVCEIVVPSTNTELASGSTNPTSSSQKRSKKTPNPNMPPREFMLECRGIATSFYRIRSQSMLKREYVRHNEEGYHKLNQDLRREIESKFEASERFNNYSDYWQHSEWLDKQVTALTTNIVANWCYHTGKKENGSDWDGEDREFVAKLMIIQDFVQNYSSSRKKKQPPWRATIEDQIQAHCISGTFKWLDSCAKIIRMPTQMAEGGYGTVRKVMITKLTSIPSWIYFAGKALKTTNEKEKRHEIINEAGGCPVKHPGIIRLAYLHPKTMEGYTLWWNGGSVGSFWSKYNSKVSETMPLDEIVLLRDTGFTAEELGWIATYRKNRVNLTLSLLVVVGKCHEANYIHNDISPSNVLLHFDDWKADTVYIGICDWGLSSRVVENEPSRYGYRTLEELEKTKAGRKFVAPELFYVFGAAGSSNSLEVMQKKHLYSMAADAYAAGWIAARIWDEEWDPKYFTTTKTEQYMNLKIKLESLTKENKQDRASVPDVLESLTKEPHCWTMPQSCFRT